MMNAARVVELVTYAGDSPVFESPSDYGLVYEDLTFTTDDGVGPATPGHRRHPTVSETRWKPSCDCRHRCWGPTTSSKPSPRSRRNANPPSPEPDRGDGFEEVVGPQ